MFEFIRIQFKLGKITAQQAQAFVPRYLTRAQCEEITGESHTA